MSESRDSGGSGSSPFGDTVRRADPDGTQPAPSGAGLPPTAAGTPFGRYRLERKLGQGAMGVVWRAWDTQLQRAVALKQLKSDPDEAPDTVDRLLREARLAARLRHPGIVGVHDAGDVDGVRFLTLDLIDGVSLEHAAESPVPHDRALTWTREIADALHYAHSQGVIHRDVKPANVLVDQGGRALVTDFGLAREADPRAGASRTASGAIVGTPHYMSPEQAQGRADLVSPASDQYSVGVVLYRLLTGRVPFEDGENLRALLNAIVEQEPVSPRRIDATIPVDVETVCLKALEKRPERRYANLGELAADLGRIQKGEPIRARPASAFVRWWRAVNRQRALVTPAAAVLLTILGFGLWAGADAQARRQRIRAALEQGAQAEAAQHWEEAGAAYGQVLVLDSENLEATTGRQRVQDRARGRAEAEKTAQGLLADAVPWVEKAAAERKRPGARFSDLIAKAERAESLIADAARAAPHLAMAPYLMGRVRELQGRDNDALAARSEAIRLDPDLGPAHYHRGRIYLKFSYLSCLSIRDDRGVVDTSAAQPLAAEVAGDFAAAFRVAWRRDTEEEALARELARGLEALILDRYEDARRLCREVIHRSPEAEGIEDFHWLLGVTSPRPDAIASLDRALMIRPNDPLMRYCRANIRAQQDEAAAARADLDVAIEFSPRFNLAWTLRGEVRRQLGDFSGAEADVTESLRIYPGMVLAWYVRGVTRIDLKDLPGALADLSEAIERSPRFASAWSERARLHNLQGQWREALADCAAAQKFAPRDLVTHLRQGDAWLGLGKLEEATAAYRAAREIDPKHRSAWLRLAQVSVQTGDAAAARATLDEGLRINPDGAELWNNRALLRARAGDLEGAIEDLEQARVFGPQNALFAYNLACIHALRTRRESIDPQAAARDSEVAFGHLSRALDLGFVDARQLDQDADLAPLRADPRWAPLRARLVK